ncbi:MAG: ACT domain-containing protein [Clostridia bacterium]|nr:ACT domain-containing protein [Clostridia bacterium]
MKAVVTVVGKDRTGIIARVSTLLYENDINILDISQTILSNDMFTMIMLVNMERATVGEVSEKLTKLADEIGMKIHLQSEEVFNSMHRI